MRHDRRKEPAGDGVRRLEKAQHELIDGFGRAIVGDRQGNGTGASISLTRAA
jgi:hypothetical protein